MSAHSEKKEIKMNLKIVMKKLRENFVEIENGEHFQKRIRILF